VTYNFKHHFSLAGRGEYISSTGNLAEHAVSLLYGPGSSAWSITLTPTFQLHRFFIRGDFSLVQARHFEPGTAFGSLGTNGTQARGVVEAGIIF
jgi:hypothetical protein